MSPRMWRRTMRTSVARLTEGPPAQGLCCQPAQAKAGGGSVRLDENDGTAAENALPRTGENGLDVHLGGRSVQPREDAQSSGSYRIWTSVSNGRKHPFGHKKTS